MKLPEDERLFHIQMFQSWARQVAQDPLNADSLNEKFVEESSFDFSIPTYENTKSKN